MSATAAWAGAATSQEQPTEVLNEQLQLGDVFATQTLNVVEAQGQTTLSTTATGNGLSGAVENGRLDLTSSQILQGDVRAATTLTAAGSAGEPVTIATQAVGNTGDAGAYGADMTADVTQTVGAVEISADTVVDAPDGATYSGASVSSTALANSQAFGLEAGRAEATVAQSSAATTRATVTGTVRYMPGPSTWSASAVSNNVSSAGQYGSQEMTVTQSMTGQATEADAYISSGNAWEVQANATATANNVAITNQGGSLDLLADQQNAGAVRAEAEVNAFDFGLGSAQAFGVGNTAFAGNNDALTLIDNTQLNTGGVESSATFTGTDGYDAYASSTAIGNAVTGYACSDCPGMLNARNSQTNSADVSATAQITVNGANRAVIGAATAIGNTASFYVSGPQ